MNWLIRNFIALIILAAIATIVHLVWGILIVGSIDGVISHARHSTFVIFFVCIAFDCIRILIKGANKLNGALDTSDYRSISNGNGSSLRRPDEYHAVRHDIPPYNAGDIFRHR